MTPKMPKKGSKGIKKTKKPRAKKKVQVDPVSDSDDSESLLGPEGPSQRPVSEHDDMEEGEEASNRPGPEATQEDPEDPDEDSGAPARKRAHVSDELTMTQEQDLVDFFADRPLFYDQTLKDFKNRPKNCLLDDKGNELGMSGECQFYSNAKTVKKDVAATYEILIIFIIYLH